MIISNSQLHNVSKTIYFLMRGVYNLDVFVSPYNDLITNEFDVRKGKALNYFNEVYDKIHSLITLFNRLENTDREEYCIIERLHDAITNILEEITVSSISMGYLCAKKVISQDLGTSPYETYFKMQILLPKGIGNKSYRKFLIVCDDIKQYLIKVGDTNKEGEKIIDDLWEALELELSVFVNTGYTHGKALGNNIYPLWYNDEFENYTQPL